MTPYYQDDYATLFHGDCREVLHGLTDYTESWGSGECVVVDPPWDSPELLEFTAATVGEFESLLAFTDARRFADPIRAFGPPDWVFTWDTMNTWSLSPSQPVQQTKHALWWGTEYDRDGELWGDAPPARDHPTTKQVPLDGRRLTDLYRQSLRWLHHPGAGSGSAGTERFATRQGDPLLRHAKPVAWLRCLIGNTSCGPVIDPFMGSGSAVVAAAQLGRQVIGIDTNEAACEMTAKRLAVDFDAHRVQSQEAFDFGGAA